MRVEFRCEHCDYATGIFGTTDAEVDDLTDYYDWCDEVDAHERECQKRVEAEAAARRERDAAPVADHVVDYVAQATALLARADRAEATRQPMLAATYRKAAETRILRARISLRHRQLEEAAPVWCRQVALKGPEALVLAVADELRVDDALAEMGQPPIGAVLSARWKAVA
ncbi:hypothetical protein [Zhihengliuella halotolerans]|uniref:Uncharacterized protein n=1 Tax=Zhihengliuella halotolerans TaxID=370736 RepID=A0A4Q8AC45_9MICC|nr:hypothetical protein [Zhihengliuella halotolerans]RZU61767.1 hypothetical protein EV380_1345 [Zhihengliuella halotolerans]